MLYGSNKWRIWTFRLNFIWKPAKTDKARTANLDLLRSSLNGLGRASRTLRVSRAGGGGGRQGSLTHCLPPCTAAGSWSETAARNSNASCGCSKQQLYKQLGHGPAPTVRFWVEYYWIVKCLPVPHLWNTPKATRLTNIITHVHKVII